MEHLIQMTRIMANTISFGNAQSIWTSMCIHWELEKMQRKEAKKEQMLVELLTYLCYDSSNISLRPLWKHMHTWGRFVFKEKFYGG